jgi:hypothetical protein
MMIRLLMLLKMAAADKPKLITQLRPFAVLNPRYVATHREMGDGRMPAREIGPW